MVRVQDNWEQLVKATLRRTGVSSSVPGHGCHPSGIAGSVSDVLGKSTKNIDAILQAANEIQAEDPNVARILSEQAYSLHKILIRVVLVEEFCSSRLVSDVRDSGATSVPLVLQPPLQDPVNAIGSAFQS